MSDSSTTQTDEQATGSASGTDRLPLYALAAHAAGDFPLQTDWMAEDKFDSKVTRAVHVAVYTAAYIPVVIASGWSNRRSVTFLGTVAATHFAIDSRRWNDAVPIWYDQALHVIALAVAFAVADQSVDTATDQEAPGHD